MKTIYLDILIVLNIYVNFFLLKATAKFTHTPLRTLRCISASVIGSLFSLSILLPSGSFLLSLLIKLIAAAVITFAAFGKKPVKSFARLLLYFYIINFIFAGVVMLLYITFKPSFMAFNNSYFYVDFSLISLVVFTTIAYGAVYALRYFLDKGQGCSKRYSVSVSYKNGTVSLNAISDTGNALVDGFSGKPVIICPRSAFSFEGNGEPCDDMEMLCEKHRFRLIPYSTVSGEGVLPVFEPDEIVITEEETQKAKKVSALVGLSENSAQGIFNPKILL